ncbi:ankyrin repeat [Micractinium conductrix]|uniref:Ankyrin repeat n=1 Tax=Micractinium conductrix TaxID=554055 RepID=A0A2P6VC87_9CHLO|nr:ankyrin repeat [Micractinium conductrix]|eukprot:PSC71698.1 ankyrin repeat [Micractinium conductrix]
MRAPSTLALLACLAMACHGAAAAAAGCAAEKHCVGLACGSSYAATAASFPYTVDYITTGSVDTTTFHFKVCSTACDPSSPTCQPLKAFRLRLANAVLAKPSDFIEGPTEGSIAATCADGGAGWWLRGAELGYLAETPVSAECEKFEVTVFNQPGGEVPMLLSELCQQGVQIVRPDGTVAFDQAAEGASCLYTLELADGTAGVAALAKAGAVKPPPTPSPSPRLPPPSLRPTPYYYGSSARRLQQAPFVRSLLAATYYYGSRHLKAAFPASDEPLAFATRRLMEASVVPLPARLAARLPSHLAAPGRTLAGYGYYGSAGHRRSLMSVGPASRQLSSYGYYGSGGHRRSLMSVGTAGRQLSSYGYYGSGGHRRSLMSVGIAGRQLSSYSYYGSGGHRRSLMSVGTAGRQLSSYGYYGSGGHRRSLMSVGTAGRQLSSYGYYGSGGHRRSLMSVGIAGRQLSSYGYYGSGGHRRSLMSVGTAGRQLSSYSYYGSGGHRRSLMSVGTAGRQLSSYSYYGSGGHRRSLMSVGIAGRQLSSYGYYGSGGHRRSLMSLSSYGGYYGQRRLLQAGTFIGARRLTSYGGYYGSR